MSTHHTTQKPDLQKLIKQAADYVERWELIKAKPILKQILDLNPTDPVAMNMVGVIAQRAEFFDIALLYYNQALKAKPMDPGIIANMGSAYSMLLEYEKAAICFKQALKLDPTHPLALIELARVIARKNPEEGMRMAKQALSLHPNNTDGSMLLATLLNEQGRVPEAIQEMEVLLANGHQNMMVYEDLVNQYFRTQNEASLAALLQKIDTNHAMNDVQKSGTYVFQLFFDYLKGDDERFAKHLPFAVPVVDTALSSQRYRVQIVFAIYLCLLSKYKESHPDWFPKTWQGETLYTIGESHSLSTANLLVNFQGKEYCCKASMAIGTKAFHLQPNKRNQFMFSVEKAIEAIPAGSTLVSMFGEIDCRADEGIITYWEKHPEINIFSHIENMVTGYVDYILSVSKKQGIKEVIFYGVPAPREGIFTIDESYDETSDDLRDKVIAFNRKITITPSSMGELAKQSTIIAEFNKSLEHAATAKGCPFIDVYNITNNRNGRSSGEFHIDGVHLTPEAVRMAFTKK